MRLTPVWPIPFFLALVACASAGNPAVSTEPAPEGATFSFVASIPNRNLPAGRRSGNLQIAGSVVRLADSVLVFPDAECEPLPSGVPVPDGIPLGGAVVSVYCNGAWLTFNRQNPATARWYTSKLIRRTEEVCRVTGTRQGRNVCLERERVSRNTRENRSGAIKVERR